MPTATAPIDNLQTMASNMQTHTALQALLLFQTLASHRPDSSAFAHVAQALRESALLSQGTGGGSDHAISPDGLQALYNQIVNTEARTGSTNNVHLQNGVGDRSGKFGPDSDNPHFKAVDVIPRLYEDYRRRIIEDIRVEERNYTQLAHEINNLESLQEKDNDQSKSQLLKTAAESTSLIAVPSSDGVKIPATDKSLASSEPKTDVKEPQGETSIEQSFDKKARQRRANASIDCIINHDEPNDDKFARPSTAGSGTIPTPVFPHQDLPYAPTHGHSSSQTLYSSTSPTHDSRLMQDPRSGPPRAPVPSHSPTTPVILPPPPGMNPPAFPPTSPYSPHADSAFASAYRTHVPPYHSHQYPAHDPYATTRYPEPYSPASYTSGDGRRLSSSGPPPPRPNYPSYQAQSTTYPAPSQYQQAQRGGVILPPFQVTPHAPGSSQLGQLARLPPHSASQATQPKRLSERTFPTNGTISTPTQPPHATIHPSPLSAPHTVFLRKSGVSASPGSTTIWRNSLGGQARERSPPRSVSPPTDREATPTPPRGAAGKGRKGRMAKTAESRTTPLPVRSSRERSQSVSSHVSESLISSRTGKGRRIKHEPPATPDLTSADGGEAEVATKSQSLRRGQSIKRKRTDSNIEGSVADAAATPTTLRPPDTVTAYRNFGKMAQPVMNVISSHKHASLFAEPVRERQAEGYRDIIKRPQDLKSIRAAIAAGSRAVAAAVEVQQGSPGSTSGSASGNAVVLPVSEALVPPKGIVNAAQLEQEVMRMFANAVMFNPGDDEIVQDSREMFESVEQALQQWRDVERMEESEEMPREEEEGAVASAKRRRL